MKSNRLINTFGYVAYDFLIAFLSTVLSFMLLKLPVEVYRISQFVLVAGVWCICTVFGLYVVKIYNILWRFSGFNEILRIFAGCIVPFLAICISEPAVLGHGTSISLHILNYLITVSFIVFQRFAARRYEIKQAEKNSNSPKTNISGNVMIIGAGAAGEAVIKELSGNKNVKIKCAIDDSPMKIGQYIDGVHIVGGIGSIVTNAEKYDIDTIIFAIPTCSIARRTEILNICQLTKCSLKILPQLYQLENVNEYVPAIRKVEIEDLLGREPIKVNLDSVMGYVKDQVVLVTGGGGTIGSELCRQIASYNPKQLIIFDIYENNAYEIQNELKYSYPELDLVTLIGSVRDSKRMDYIFRTYKPNIVYHAAAHKHVPLMEDSPNESIKNNVFGTYKTAECADKYGVKRFVLISTDKAVNPTNIMGASKRICEMIVQTFNEKSDTEFVAVRFGNVLGSNGSVIPLFKKQLEQGGPLTVTDPNIIRYFMTIPEAVSLVLQAGANAKGGEIFVLDMGQPVKILSLAENLIKLSGFEPYKDIAIEFTGLRPGEKLYEELLMSEEGLRATENELIHIGKPIEIDTDELYSVLEKMKQEMYDENADIRALVKQIVPTYQIPKKQKEKATV
ncbi:MAG: polysaccharide biosynthesis protein [Ruminococcaceae bacterium]|nr:polysaccharide biosynthesis protein [Oscillospiraceae bacterium]